MGETSVNTKTYWKPKIKKKLWNDLINLTIKLD